MRVLLICHGLPPESVGGVEQHVEGLSHALVEMGCEVAIFARTSNPRRPQGETFVEREENPRVARVVYRWEGVGALPDLYESPELEAALRGFLASEHAAGRTFDVAHVHHLTGLSTGALAVLQNAGVPTVLTLHDYWLMCPRGQMWHRREEFCPEVEVPRCGECLAATFPHWLTPENTDAMVAALHERARRVLAIPQALVVPSARAIAPFLALGVPPERFQVVENGVDTKALQTLPPPAPDDGPLALGYLGTLIPSKGLHVLIEALHRLPHDTVQLHVFGNAVAYHGDDGYLTRIFSSLRPGDRVVYHGPYETAELPRILSRLDAVAAPALWAEAFGLTVREALAAGRPVLVSGIGGLQDAVADGVEGRVLPPGDPAAWAEALAALAADRARIPAMAEACRQRSRGFAPMARELLDLYLGIGALDRTPPSP